MNVNFSRRKKANFKPLAIEGNFDKTGNITGGKTVYLNSEPDLEDEENKEYLTENKLMPLKVHKELDDNFDLFYVCGKKGSGKSFFIKLYIQSYEEAEPDNFIYFFSIKKEDPKIKELSEKYDNIDRIDPAFYNEGGNPENYDIPETLEDMKNSLVIFDDCDGLKEKEYRGFYALMKEVMLRGRSLGIDCLVSSHSSTLKGFDDIRNNTDFLVMCGPLKQRVRYTKIGDFTGLDKRAVLEIEKKYPSHYYFFNDSTPSYVITENAIVLL